MKILYELEIDCDQKFNANDFPSQIEVLRSGSTPLVFKPVVLQTQDIYSKLQEADELLKIVANKLRSANLTKSVYDYLNRNKQ